MKRATSPLCLVCLAWLGVVALFSAVYCLNPLVKHGFSCSRAELRRFCDFTMRMNEAECLRRGVDPYDVWAEHVSLPPYVSLSHRGPALVGCDEIINAYVPWEYALALPLSMLPRSVAWLVYCSFMLLAAAGAFLMSMTGCRVGCWQERVLAPAVALSVVAYSLWSNAGVGNMAVFLLAGAIGMAWCMNQGRVWLAGVCWAIVMLKPQIGLPFAIPLVMRMKWKSCFVAIMLCIVLSFPSAFLCGKSLLALIVQAPAAGASAFEGCGTWPKFLCGTFENGVDIVVGTLVGVVVCAAMTWLVRKEKDWFVFLMPAAITSCCWTYTQAYSHAMGWFVAFVLVRELLCNPQSKFLWMLAAFAAVSLTRWLLAWHGLVAFAGWRFPMSDYAFRCVDSLNSTLSLAIAFALCVWIWRRDKEALHE